MYAGSQRGRWSIMRETFKGFLILAYIPAES